MLGKNVLYDGFDESNHGDFPEIMVLVTTYNPFYLGKKKNFKKRYVGTF